MHILVLIGIETVMKVSKVYSNHSCSFVLHMKNMSDNKSIWQQTDYSSFWHYPSDSKYSLAPRHIGLLQKLWRKKFCKLWLSLSLTCPRWAPCVTHLSQTSSHIYEFFLYSTAGIWPSLSPNISFSAAPCPKWSSMLSQNNHQRILNCFSRGENGFASKQMQSLT